MASTFSNISQFQLRLLLLLQVASFQFGAPNWKRSLSLVHSPLFLCLSWGLPSLGFVLRYFYLYFYILYIHLFICLPVCLFIKRQFRSLPLFLIVVNALLVVVVVALFGLLCGFPAFYIFYQYPQSLGSVHLPKKESQQQQQQRKENQQPTINTAETTTTTWLLTLLVARCRCKCHFYDFLIML